MTKNTALRDKIYGEDKKTVLWLIILYNYHYMLPLSNYGRLIYKLYDDN